MKSIFETKELRIAAVLYAQAFYDMDDATARLCIESEEKLQRFYRERKVADPSMSLTLGDRDEFSLFTDPVNWFFNVVGWVKAGTKINVEYVKDYFKDTMRESKFLVNKDLARELHAELYEYQQQKANYWLSSKNPIAFEDGRYLVCALIDRKLHQIHTETDSEEKVVDKIEKLVAFVEGILRDKTMTQSSDSAENGKRFMSRLTFIDKKLKAELRDIKSKAAVPNLREALNALDIEEEVKQVDKSLVGLLLLGKDMSQQERRAVDDIRAVCGAIAKGEGDFTSSHKPGSDNYFSDLILYVKEKQPTNRQRSLEKRINKVILKNFILKPYWAQAQLEMYHQLLRGDKQDEASDLLRQIDACLKTDWTVADLEVFKRAYSPLTKKTPAEDFVRYINTRNRMLKSLFYLREIKQLTSLTGELAAFLAEDQLRAFIDDFDKTFSSHMSARAKLEEAISDSMGSHECVDKFINHYYDSGFSTPWKEAQAREEGNLDAIFKIRKALTAKFSDKLPARVIEVLTTIEQGNDNVLGIDVNGERTKALEVMLKEAQEHQREEAERELESAMDKIAELESKVASVEEDAKGKTAQLEERDVQLDEHKEQVEALLAIAAQMQGLLKEGILHTELIEPLKRVGGLMNQLSLEDNPVLGELEERLRALETQNTELKAQLDKVVREKEDVTKDKETFAKRLSQSTTLLEVAQAESKQNQSRIISLLKYF